MTLYQYVAAAAADIRSSARASRRRSRAYEAAPGHRTGPRLRALHGHRGHPQDFSALTAAVRRAGATPLAAARSNTQRILDAVEELVADLDQADNRTHLVGHSLGGVIAALAAARRPDAVASLVTISAPLSGSAWASLPLLRTSVLADVAPNTPVLAPIESLAATGLPVLCIAGAFDPIVPVGSATAVPTAVSVVVPHGHFSSLGDPVVLDTVLSFTALRTR